LVPVPATHDFTYAEVVTYIGAIGAALSVPALPAATYANRVVAAAYGHTDTIITGPITAWVLGLKAGASTMDRLRGRALETLYLVQQVVGVFSPSLTGFTVGTPATYGTWGATSWISILKSQTAGVKDTSTSSWIPARSAAVAHGWGVMEAARGALMHHITQSNDKITKYQCIVPTTWNGSPMILGSGDVATDKLVHGAIEASCMGLPFSDATSPVLGAYGGVEVMRIAQSFDPCIACAIH
jgi:Ni,Fe-hydrogenase I large subunit